MLPGVLTEVYAQGADKYRFSDRHSSWLLPRPAQTTIGRQQDDREDHGLQSPPARHG